MRRLANVKDDDSHERSFLARIRHIRKQCLRISGDPTTAEDLVQDAYVRFVLSKPDLSRIVDLDAYLTTLVRNMHLSRVRRARRRPETSIDLLDYDSLNVAAGTIDGRNRLDARHALRAACTYGCIRRLSAKTGSVFLLRFFHGLTTSEVARVARASNRAVDEWVRQARGELRLYLADPSRLRFVPQHTSVVEQHVTIPAHCIDDTVDALVAELRAEIIAHRHSQCLKPSVWGRLYATDADSVPTDVLAEIATCDRCLDEALSRNELPPKSGPGPFDDLRDQQSRGPSRISDALSRRTQRVKEHRPRAFTVAVNGFVVGREHISGKRSELTLSVTLNEPVALVEIMSEQDVCLLSLLVEPPPVGDATQCAAVSLSDDRSLTLEVCFADPWPELHVSFVDPSLATSAAEAVEIKPNERTPPTRARRPLFWRQALEAWRRFRPAHTLWRPMAAGALVAAALVVAYVWADRWQPTVTASELLRQADFNHRKFISAPGFVFHRVVRLEARDVSESRVRSRQRIETWQDAPGTGIRATRVYDDADRLIAGEWINAGGIRTVYRHGEAPRVEAPSEARRTTPDEMWRWDVSPADFTQLAGGDQAITMRRGNRQVGFEAAPVSGVIASAKLTLAEDGLRPIWQTLVVRVGDGLVEYRFEEASAERIPAAEVPPERFEPEPALSDALVSGTPELPPAIPARAAPPVIQAVALDRWELTATWRLHRLSTCLATPGRLERRRDRGLVVAVVAASEPCRTEITTAFADFSGQAGLVVNVQVATLLPERPGSNDASKLREVTDDELQRLPAYKPLFEYYARAAARSHSEPADLDAAVRPPIRQLVIWCRDMSARIRQRVDALRTLNRRWTIGSLTALDLDARNMWQQLVREQTRALGQDVQMLRLQLEPALFAGVQADAPTGTTLATIADVGPALTRLCDLVEQADRQVQMALRAPEADQQESRVDGGLMGLLLRTVEQQVAMFDEPWRLEP